MELNHLKYFYAVARNQSFTRASRELRVSQSSISKILKQFEHVHGIRLLDRARRSKVELTEVGRTFFESCEKIFGEVEQLSQALKNKEKECQGPLSIGASDNLCNHVLPQLFREFLGKHEKVAPKVFSGTSEEIKNELRQSRLELGLFHSEVTEGDLVSEKLAYCSFGIYVAPSLFRRYKTASSLLSLATFIGPRGADYVRPFPILRMLEAKGIAPKHFYEANTQETQKKLAIEGLGYAVLPEYMTEKAVRGKKLLRLEATKTMGSNIYWVKKRNKTLSRGAETFLTYLKARLPILVGGTHP